MHSLVGQNGHGGTDFWLSFAESEQDWLVAKVVFRYADRCNQVDFDRPRALEEVFVPALAQMLRGRLDIAPVLEEAFDRAFSLVLPGLLLSGLHIGQRGSAGSGQEIYFRFDRAQGDLEAVFNNRHRALPQPDDLVVSAVQDVLKPALEAFDYIVENGLSEEHSALLRARLQMLQNRRQTLGDYTDILVQIAVRSSQNLAVVSPTDALEPHWGAEAVLWVGGEEPAGLVNTARM